jgi:hypothetical protein
MGDPAPHDFKDHEKEAEDAGDDKLALRLQGQTGSETPCKANPGTSASMSAHGFGYLPCPACGLCHPKGSICLAAGSLQAVQSISQGADAHVCLRGCGRKHRQCTTAPATEGNGALATESMAQVLSGDPAWSGDHVPDMPALVGLRCSLSLPSSGNFCDSSIPAGTALLRRPCDAVFPG